MRKKLLILDKDAHEYDKFIGDISGQDIEYHSEDPQMLMQKIRNWIARLFPKAIYPLNNRFGIITINSIQI